MALLGIAIELAESDPDQDETQFTLHRLEPGASIGSHPGEDDTDGFLSEIRRRDLKKKSNRKPETMRLDRLDKLDDP